MKALITGGAGFIGTNLALSLRDAGHGVTVYDNFMRNSIKYFDHHDIKIIDGDIRLFDVRGSYDWVIHCAAICGIESVGDIRRNIDVNVVGAKNVIDRFAGDCGHFVFLSTCEVEGLHPNSYQYALFEPRWSYAIGKVCGEYYCRSYIEEGLPVTIVRPSNVYGQGQVGDSAVANFIRAMLTDRKVRIYNDGRSIRCWCYISDFVEGIGLILNKKAVGETFTIGNPGGRIRTLDLLDKICEICEVEPEKTFMKHFCTDIEEREVDISAMEILGYMPKVGLDEGLRKAVRWYVDAYMGI